MTKYEIWEGGDGECKEITLLPSTSVEFFKEHNLMGDNPNKLVEFEAETWEDAKIFQDKFMGWE